MADGEATTTDADIALMMAVGDEEGLCLFLDRYGGRMGAYLTKHYGHVLQQAERDEALNWAIAAVWRFADRYDERKGQMASWCIRITQRAAQSVLRRERRFCSKHHEYDAHYDPAAPDEDGGSGQQVFDDNDPRWKLVLKAIDMLPPLQRAIIQADLAAGGSADAQRLTEIHGTSTNSIYVSRNKAIANLKKRVEELVRQPPGMRR